MASQRERTGMETFVSLLKFWAAMIYLPICLFFAFFHTISSEDGDGEIALIFWALLSHRSSFGSLPCKNAAAP